MRTTLTLDDDVTAMLEAEAHRTRLPFKQVVNDAIRRGLAPRAGRSSQPPYRVPVHSARLAPGIDPARLNQLVDELDEEAQSHKLAGGR